MVQRPTDLFFILVIVARPGRLLDKFDVGMFRDVCTPLKWYTIQLDVRRHTLHHLQLRNVPVVDGPITLAGASSCIQDRVFVTMKILQGVLYPHTYIIVKDRGLCEIPKVEEGTNSNNEIRR